MGLGVLVAHPRAAPAESPRRRFAAILYLFSACVGLHAPRHPHHVLAGRGLLRLRAPGRSRSACLPLLRDGWGLSPKVDQQIGGLLMWVPACLVYGAAILGDSRALPIA